MAEQYYDRYGYFKMDGQVKPLPFLKIPNKATDIIIVMKENTRFDILSQKYYGNGKHGWIILQANPTFGGLQEDIPIGTKVRIPFPFMETLQQIESSIKRHIKLYGI